MSKIKVDFRALEPFLNKAGELATKGADYAVKLFKNKDFQKGLAAGAAIIIPAGIYISILKKKLEGKEHLYTKALAKHNAVIKELDAKAELDKDRQDQLLALDAQLKKEMLNQQAEIRELKDKIAELEKKKANDE